jgi:hypothetical protein
MSSISTVRWTTTPSLAASVSPSPEPVLPSRRLAAHRPLNILPSEARAAQQVLSALLGRALQSLRVCREEV